MKRRILAAFLAAHALAQLVGFTWPWWLTYSATPAAPAPNDSVLGNDTVVHVMSSLWLVVAAAFMLAALAVLHRHPAARRITAAAAIASLALCLLSWPGSLLGLPINAAILVVVRWPRWLAWHLARA